MPNLFPDRSFVRRSTQILTIFVAVGTVFFAWYGWWLRHYLSFLPEKDRVTSPRREAFTPLQNIDGFRYEFAEPGKGESLVITADRLIVTKGKVGFLRVGLMNDIEMRNTVIHLHHARLDGGSVAGAGDGAGAIGRSEKDQSTWRGGWVFEKTAPQAETSGAPAEPVGLFPLQPKFVSAIRFQPVTFFFQDETQDRQSRISATEAAIKVGTPGLSLRGAISVVAGGKSLTATAMTVDLEYGLLRIKDYKLATDRTEEVSRASGKAQDRPTEGGERRGQGMITDFFLEEIAQK